MSGVGDKPFVDITPTDAWAKAVEAMNSEEAQNQPPAESNEAPPEEKAEVVSQAPIDAMSKLDELIDAIQSQNASRSEAAEVKPTEENTDDKVLENLREQNPALAEMYEQLMEVKGKLAEIEQRDSAAAVEREISALDNEIKEATGAYSLSARQVAEVINYMDTNPDVAKVLSFQEATLRVFPTLTRSGSMEAAAAEENAPARTQATARIVSQGSNGSAPLKEYKPGPGKEFDDISSFVLKKHFSVRG